MNGKKQGPTPCGARTDMDHCELAARRLVDWALTILGLSRRDLDGMAKGDERKRLIGAIVRRRTTMSLRWIGTNLRMGCESRVSRLCRLDDDRRLAARGRMLGRAIDKMARSKAFSESGRASGKRGVLRWCLGSFPFLVRSSLLCKGVP